MSELMSSDGSDALARGPFGKRVRLMAPKTEEFQTADEKTIGPKMSDRTESVEGKVEIEIT